jgi:hypothetical protein
MHLRTKLAALTAAGGTAMLMLASTPAFASGSAITETAYGAIYGKAATANNSIVPLTWRGLVDAHGVFSSNGGPPQKGQQHTLSTSAGNFTVQVTAPPTNSQNINLKACRFSFTTRVAFTVVGGKSTGRFAGASGPGTVEVTGGGYAPRYTSGPHKGQCNTSNNAPELTNGAFETFQLSADLKL